MFEHFSDFARISIVDAAEEARSVAAPTIEPSHLVLALSRREKSLAGKELARVGLVRDRLPGAEGEVPSTAAHIPFGRATKEVLEKALLLRMDQDASLVTTGHLLLAVVTTRNADLPAAFGEPGADWSALDETTLRASEPER